MGDKYPDLSEEAAQLAAATMDEFRKQLKRIADQALDEIYTNIASHVQGDSWTNFRNSIWAYVLDYRSIDPHEGRRLRNRIFEDNRQLILEEIGEDLAKENARLKELLEEFHSRRSSFA